MSSFVFGLGLVLSLLAMSMAKNTYVVMMQKTIRPNLATKVHVNILKASGKVFVTATLEDNLNNTIVSRSNAFDPQSAGFIELMVPADIGGGKYYMRVEGKGGLEFSNRTELQFMSKSSSILIQTDRAIYKPGQTVKFRIFGIYPDLSLVNSNLDISIYDPKKNKIAQYKDRSDPSGIVTDEMVMSDHPVLGDWKIKVTQGRETREKTFTVAEYVLPKFEVSVVLPSFGLSTEPYLHVKVRAMYTFGKPVDGTGVLRIRRKYPMFWRRHEKNYVDSTEERFKISGEKEIKIELAEIRKIDHNLAWSEFVVEANVTEGITGFRMNDSAEIKFYDTAEKIEFIQSLPSNFKPGLTYKAFLRVTQKDDTPISDSSTKVKVDISHRYPIEETTTSTTTTETPPMLNPEENMNETELLGRPKILHHIIRPFPRYPRYETVDLPPMYFDVGPDGIVMFDVVAPEKVSTVELKATFKKETAYKNLDQAKSPSNSYIQIQLLDEKLLTNSNGHFEIKSTQPLDKIMYQIISKGMVMDAGTIDMGMQNVKQFPLFITTDMAPKARIIIQYVRPDGEIVADGITFKVDQIFKNKVGIAFDRRRAQPGEKVNVDLEASPNSKVEVLAIDKSVLLLKTGNDITEDEITRELQSYDTSMGGSFPGFWMWRWPIPSGGQDASDVFENNGMVVMTDALLYNYVRPWRPIILRNRAMPMMAMAMANNRPTAFVKKGAGKPPKPKSLPKSKKIRKTFPETWIWDTAYTGLSGKARMQVTAPDTITSWVATAFAVSPQHGLGLAPGPSNLEVFLPYFVRVNLPYSVVRDETVVIQADVFNYDISAWTLIVLEENPGINNVVAFGKGKFRDYSNRVGRWLWVPKGKVRSAYFPIIPKRAGEMKIKINSMSVWHQDAVERTLLVKPEGTPEEYNTPVLIDLARGPVFTKTVNIDFPADTVPDSRRIRASTMGDIMGPSINGIEKLLKMPYGCGEQNMLNFAPNIFVRRYLNVTNHLTSAIDSKAKNFMVKGYQREMTYQHNDGSFSAFGESDKSGTTWLTAFVVKSFAQASDSITIDDDAVVKAVRWLMEQQRKDGSFNEPGKVLHKEMQGGSAGGDVSLAAFVLIAMIEGEVVPGVSDITERSVRMATTYLENSFDAMIGAPIPNLYKLAIVGYALTLARSPKVSHVLDELDRLATKDGGMMYWEQPKQEPTPEEEFVGWKPPHVQANALNIELTSYALMIYAARQDTQNGLKVLRWLTTQRNSDGGFSSTQDTVVALQALSEIAGLIYNPNFNMRITLTTPDNTFFHEFNVDETNALVLQTVEVPDTVRQLTVTANGRGMSLVEVATYFNVLKDLKTKAFDLRVNLTDETKQGFNIEVCGRWMRKDASQMAIIEIGVPSGMTPDLDTFNTQKAPEYKFKESTARGLVLYFDQFDGRPQCVSVYMTLSEMVADQKITPVKIYDYYDKDKQATTFYSSKVLSSSSVCDVCKENCWC